MDDEKPKILVADSHSCSRVGLCYILEINGFSIAGEANCSSELASLIKKLEPDILIISNNLLTVDIKSFLTKLYPKDIKMSIVLLLDTSEQIPIRDLYLTDVKGFIDQAEPISNIIQMISTVGKGSITFSESLMPRLMNSPTSFSINHQKIALDLEEKQLLQLLCSDKSNIEIAEILHLSPKTVEKQLSLLYEKLDVRSRTGAAVWYLQNIK